MICCLVCEVKSFYEKLMENAILNSYIYNRCDPTPARSRSSNYDFQHTTTPNQSTTQYGIVRRGLAQDELISQNKAFMHMPIRRYAFMEFFSFILDPTTSIRESVCLFSKGTL
jgi:hypothetical protein